MLSPPDLRLGAFFAAAAGFANALAGGGTLIFFRTNRGGPVGRPLFMRWVVVAIGAIAGAIIW